MTLNARIRVFALFLSLLAAQSGYGQWRIATPRQTLPIPSDGTVINFPNVDLPVGMRYHVHADGRVVVSSSNDIADACYYVNIIPIGSGLSNEGLKIRSSASLEAWTYDLLSPQGYHTNHIYDVGLPSVASTLSIRFYDRADAPNAYYNDNSGTINVEVAQETPAIVAQYDTVYFNDVLVGKSLALIDSLASYGTDGYRCDRVAMLGPSAARFQVFGQVVPFGIQESATDFQFVYSPISIGSDTAFFHLYSSNVYAPQQDFVIVLIGNGVGSKLTVKPDTLDFGTIAVNSTKSLTAMFKNGGTTAATVSSITMSPAAPFTNTAAPIVVNSKDSSPCVVTFAPVVVGNYLARFDCIGDDGSNLIFYAKGVAGSAKVRLSDTTLVFGRLLLNQSRALIDTIVNVGNVNLDIVNTVLTNGSEYSVLGSQGPHSYAPLSGAVYVFTFTPNTHIPAWGNHDGSFTFNYSDGTSSTIYFRGCDHVPVSAHLSIDTDYVVLAGEMVEVAQHILEPLDSSFLPIRALSERISYDPQTFDFVSARKGELTNTPDWKLNTTSNPGVIDISLSATTDHIGPAGNLVYLTFRAHADANAGEATLLPQLSIDFANSYEPLIAMSSGRIVVVNQCNPIRLVKLGTAKASFIEQNVPNPTTHETTLRYTIGDDGSSQPSSVRISLFDEMGRRVRTVLDQIQAPGHYELTLSTADLSAGLYSYVFEASGRLVARRSMVVTK